MFHSSTNRFGNTPNSHGLFPWLLRKKASRWSLGSLAKMNTSHTMSMVSLPNTITSNETIEPTPFEQLEEQEEEHMTVDSKDEPPCYDDKTHPWTFQMPKSLAHRIILPREEEGKESLPDYECTVQKINYVKMKCEFSSPGVKSSCRSWKYLHVQIYGTMIMAYTESPERNKRRTLTPVWTFSMHGSEATVASDYLKERHVIRLKIENGPQFLMTVPTEALKAEWIAIMETSMNISSDLDVRSMPQFITLISRRRANGGSRQRHLPADVDSPLL